MNATFPRQGSRVINFNRYPTYNLTNSIGKNARFYSELENVTDQVVETGLRHFSADISDFGKLDSISRVSKSKTEKEYLLEILMIGVLWNKYQGRWRWYNSLVNPVFRQLIFLRKTFLKKPADKVRGKLNSMFLYKNPKRDMPFDHDNFNNLIVWLSSTGEYQMETKLFSKWLYFLYNGIKRDSYGFLAEAAAYGEWFESYTQKHLGIYTDKVPAFLLTQPKVYKGREDLFFTGVSQVEYHLNMVGGAMLNKAFRPAFLQTKRKILLLPTCMVSNTSCGAKTNKNGMVCKNCTSNCHVSEISAEMKKYGVEIKLFQHTSDFTKWIKPWANQTNTGLIGTACVMNLLSGGYALNKLNIPSQCIYLDFSGCSKHWCKQSIPTSINVSRLLNLVDNENAEKRQPEKPEEQILLEKEPTVA